MNLYNSFSVSAGVRRCYWDPRYIASQPFCLSSKLTDKEAQSMAEFEEQKFWERTEVMKAELSIAAQNEFFENLDDFKKDGIMEAAEQAILGLDSITSKLGPDLRTKPSLKRFNYLTR